MAKNRQREREARVSVRSLFLSLSSSLRFLSRSLKAPMLPSLSFSLVHSRGRGVQHHASSTHVQIIQRGEIAPATNTCKAYTRKCTWNTTQGQDSGQRDRERERARTLLDKPRFSEISRGRCCGRHVRKHTHTRAMLAYWCYTVPSPARTRTSAFQDLLFGHTTRSRRIRIPRLSLLFLVLSFSGKQPPKLFWTRRRTGHPRIC